MTFFNLEVLIYIVSYKYSGIYKTEDGFTVRFLPLQFSYRFFRLASLKFKRFKRINFLAEYSNFIGFRQSLNVAFEEDKIDLLYVQEYWSNRFDFLINSVKDIPIIGADHGLKDKLAISSIKKKTLPRAAKLTCQTSQELSKVRGLGVNAMLLPNGIDIDFYLPSHGERIKSIFICARLYDRQKRVSDLIKSLSYLDKSWKLEIAGSGPDLGTLKKLSKKLNLEHRVVFLGFISDKTVLRDHYRNCSIFALPSAFEGLPLVVLEAMSCGASVVTTDIDAFESLIVSGENGIKVKVGNPAALANGILQCYEHRALIGANARKTIVETYSKQIMLKQLSDLIHTCVQINR